MKEFSGPTRNHRSFHTSAGQQPDYNIYGAVGRSPNAYMRADSYSSNERQQSGRKTRKERQEDKVKRQEHENYSSQPISDRKYNIPKVELLGGTLNQEINNIN